MHTLHLNNRTKMTLVDDNLKASIKTVFIVWWVYVVFPKALKIGILYLFFPRSKNVFEKKNVFSINSKIKLF